MLIFLTISNSISTDMTVRGRARILMLVSLLLLSVSGGYAYLSARRVARLRALQTATQVALRDAFRLMVDTGTLLHSTGSILQPFEDWKSGLRRNADNLQGLAAHPGLALLADELSDRAAQVLRAWKLMEESHFAPAEQALTRVLETASGDFGAQGVTAGRALALSEQRLLVGYYLDMVRAERGLNVGLDTLQPFVTTILDALGQQIARQADNALSLTIRVSAAAIVVLIVSVVAALLYSIRFLDQANRGLEGVVRQRTRSIQSLLDFSGRGFLSFGPDLVIRPEHSRDCEEILGKGISGRRLADVLYPEGTSRTDFVKAMDLVFSGKSRPDVVFELIDNEIAVGDRVVRIDFRVIDSDTLMCSLEDITERRRLEGSIAEQQELREMILRAAMNRRTFVGLTREAEEVFREVHAFARDVEESTEAVAPGQGSAAAARATAAAARLEEVLQSLHTFKANAAFLRMKRTADEAHALEQNLHDNSLVEGGPGATAGLEKLVQAYQGELYVVREHLGADWSREPDTVPVRRRQLLEVERLAKTTHPQDAGLHAALEQVRMIPIGDLLDRYNETVQNLARSRAKRVRPIEVAGAETLVLPERFDRIGGALVHLVRNIVDHGIERPGERTAAGKNPEGLIRITARNGDGSLELMVCDDGRGIDFAAVEERARAMGLIEAGARPTQRDLLRLIFKSGFTTADAVTTVSGRGVGLTAVSETVRRLGGRIGVSTRRGEGTTVTLSIPDNHRGALQNES
jgi:signal transduction histidine kinase